MTLTVPAALCSILDAADNSAKPLSELDLVSPLMAALPEPLSYDARRGALATLETFRFQPVYSGRHRTWGIYWNELSTLTGADGTLVHSEAGLPGRGFSPLCSGCSTTPTNDPSGGNLLRLSRHLWHSMPLAQQHDGM